MSAPTATLNTNPFTSIDIGVKYYDFTPKQTLEEILKSSKLKKRYNESAKNFLQLVQSFDMPHATTALALSPDQEYIYAAGVHNPQVKLFELQDLTLKFERGLSQEVIKILCLTPDWKKMVLLQSWRYVEFHAQFGAYYSLRIPVQGRDMAYDSQMCDLLFVGNSNEMYRLDLEQGSFQKPYTCMCGTQNVNVIKINQHHGLYGLGCENGYVECVDPRTKKAIGILNAAEEISKSENAENAQFSKITGTGDEITALEFDSSDGVTFAVGTERGVVGLFDLRKKGPILVQEHKYQTPISSIVFHDSSKNIITTEQKVIKIWSKTNGNVLLNIETEKKINSTLVFPKSGLILVGGEEPQIRPFYVPDLGPAPAWCSFIDSVTQTVDNIKKTNLYQDFKFVTIPELEELGLEDLIGTSLLVPHLHGYFMKKELYTNSLKNKEKIGKNPAISGKKKAKSSKKMDA